MLSSLFITLTTLTASIIAADHQIVVGGTAGKVYTPSTVNAAIGDTVSFVFESLNHTVTQSAFAVPCGLFKNVTSGAVGFDSGFVPVAVGATQSPVWTLKVTVATPIWFYCKQATHCSASGMVGAINPPTEGNKTFAAFKSLAMSSTPPTAGTVTGGNNGIGASATGGLSTEVSPGAATTASNGGAYGSYGGSSSVSASISSASGSTPTTIVTSDAISIQKSATLLVVIGLITVLFV